MNLIYIIPDAVRPDYIEKANTPTIDWLAKRGTVFSQAISSAPWTIPSIASHVTGIYSHKLGVYNWNQSIDKKTIFHYFKERGVEYGSFVFDEEYMFSEMPIANVKGHSRNIHDIQKWIRQHSGNDFFLFVHGWWTHPPYELKPTAEEWRKELRKVLKMIRDGEHRAVKDMYIKSIEYFSEVILGGILDVLVDKNILDDTMIIITSDHGESWGERIKDKSEFIESTFSMHGRYLYDEILRIPLIMYYPDSDPFDVGYQVRSVDILPTICDMFDMESNPEWDGYSLRDCVRDRIAISSTVEATGRREFSDSIVCMSIRRPPWKVIWDVKPDTIMVFNIEKDRSEVFNIHSESEVELKTLLVEELKIVPPPTVLTKEEEHKIADRLRRLGYIV